ncbi:hypothetical protein [Paenibacillus allorhizoplanae]|nr:hypothetical protein [Paenibacillus allorhizoplanae]
MLQQVQEEQTGDRHPDFMLTGLRNTFNWIDTIVSRHHIPA